MSAASGRSVIGTRLAEAAHGWSCTGPRTEPAMSSFDETQINRASDGRFDFKASGAPAAALEEPEKFKTISGQDLIKVVSAMVGRQQGRIRISGEDRFDDIVQNACLEICKTYGTDRIPLAPIRQVVSTTISKAQGHANLGSTDRRAMRAFADLREDREEKLGRPLSQREENALAQEVRATWPDKRHRPSTNFLQRARLARTGKIYREDGSIVEGINPWESSESHSAAPNTAVGQAEEAINARKTRLARRRAWDALAELREAEGNERVPRVLAPTHSSQAAAWCRATLDDYPGGVMGAVDRWNQAQEDEGTIALFAPFGDVDEDGRDSVCRMLSTHPELADDLWDSALTSSTKRRK